MTVHRLGQARVVQRFKGLTNTVVESVWSDGKLVSHCELVHDHARMCGMEVTVFSVFFVLFICSACLGWECGIEHDGAGLRQDGARFPNARTRQVYLGVFRIQWYRICTCSLSVASRAIHEKEMVLTVALIQKKMHVRVYSCSQYDDSISCQVTTCWWWASTPRLWS